jgi:multiple sugar transport system ATP-binding protein
MGRLEFRGVSKLYPKAARKAVDTLDLSFGDGEFTVLVGPSGCGKSTILRMIAGLEEISQGELLLDGELLNDVEPQRRGVAMVFQSYALYPHMTVAENIGFPLRVAGERDAVVSEKVLETSKRLGLVPYLPRLPRQLSGGQRQRVALGRAMVRQPKIFLLDEPLSNLDAKLRLEMRVEIARLHRTLGTSFVYVTHDQAEAMTLGDRIVVLRDGIVQQHATPEDLYGNPANAFVGGFIGTPAMNFLEAEIVCRDGRFFLLSEGVSLAAEERDFGMLRRYGKERVLVGFRPADAAIVRSSSEEGIAGRFLLQEFLGDEVLWHVETEIGGQSKILVGKSKETTGFAPGEAAHVIPDPGRLYLFDPDGGASLRRDPA